MPRSPRVARISYGPNPPAPESLPALAADFRNEGCGMMRQTLGMRDLEPIRRSTVGSLAIFLLAATAWAQQPPVRILIAYYSETGNTEKLAQAIFKGAAAVEGVEARLHKTAEVKDQEILEADGIVVGTPVQWSNATAEAKRFLDRVGAVLWKAKTNGDGRTAGAF